MFSLGDNFTKNTAMDLQAPLQQDIDHPTTGLPKPELTACVHEKSADDVSNAAEEIPSMRNSQGLDCTAWLQFDEHGMVLPHSILGSLEDFRSYLEAKGEKNLIKRIPTSSKDLLSKVTRNRHTNSVKKMPSHQRSIQRNALQHWDEHVTHWRHQQDELSSLLGRPVEYLLMNQGTHFRETQEQKEILNRVMPLTHSGYGYHVGSEFWSLPQSYGDEMSCITATLTQTERGQRKPVTHVGQPSSIQRELGFFTAATQRPASHSWRQSSYLHQWQQEHGEVLEEMDIKKPTLKDFSRLEVIGSGKLFTSSTDCQSSILEKEEEKKECKEAPTENIDLQVNDDQLKALPIPALRISGQSASWTGNSIFNKGQVGISTTIFFEAQTGEIASSSLELQNDGSTAIFYSWQKLTAPQSFPHLHSQKQSVHFYFSSSSGVICPGGTQWVEFIFKSEDPGLKTELWQLNTHPVLLQGASIQVRLSGMALNQNKTADQRLFIENKLETSVVLKMCRSIVCEVLQRVSTPERPRSPAELYFTEEQQFHNKNPTLQYFYQPVEDLKSLWQSVNPGVTWDFSVDSLRQAVLSLPNEEPSLASKEESLVRLSSVFLQLSEPTHLKHHLTAASVGQQLWKKLLDSMSGEAMRLRNVFGLPEKEMWFDKKHDSRSCDVDDLEYKETASKEENNEMRSKFKDDAKGVSTLPMMDHFLEESKKKDRRKDDAGKHYREKEGRSPTSLSDGSEISSKSDDQRVNSEMMHLYTKTLHKKVYALMEELVEDLFDLMEEMNVEDGQNTNH